MSEGNPPPGSQPQGRELTVLSVDDKRSMLTLSFTSCKDGKFPHGIVTTCHHFYTRLNKIVKMREILCVQFVLALLRTGT